MARSLTSPTGRRLDSGKVRGRSSSATMHHQRLQRACRRATSAIELNGELRQELGTARIAARAGCGSVNAQRDLAVARRTFPTVPRDGPSCSAGIEASPDFALWVKHVGYARSRLSEARSELVKEYRPYAISLARRLHRDSEPLDDLIQVALEALLLALDRFDPVRRRPFLAYANPTILGSLKRHYRDAGWALRVPRRVHEAATPVRRTADALAQRCGRPATVDEIAAEMGVDVELVIEVNEVVSARSTDSLDAPLLGGGSKAEVFGGDDTMLVGADNRVALAQCLEELSDRDREVLHLYYWSELSQVEIGERFGVSQMQVSRWLSNAIGRLRSHLPA